MALYPYFVHAAGPYELERSIPTSASTAYNVGDAETVTSGAVAAAASGNNILGVCVEKKLSSDTSTNPVQVFKLYTGRTEFFGTVSSSTFATTVLYSPLDLSTAKTVTPSTNTNHDVLLTKILAGATDGTFSFRLRLQA